MDEETGQARELIRSGKYYEQARNWYAAIYLSPVAERTMFLVMALLGGMIFIIGLVALSGLMPLVEQPMMIIRNPKIDDTVPLVERLRPEGESVNDAYRNFLLARYVWSRESYAADQFARNSLFVTAYSDAATAGEYAAAVNPANPRSPSSLLGYAGLRLVDIRSIRVDASTDPQTAVVRFSTEIAGLEHPAKTEWTATIRFYYSDAVVIDAVDPVTGEKTATLQEPSFQVVNYVLSQRS